MEQRERIKKKKEEERKKLLMMDEEEEERPQTMNIVLQDDGIHDSVYPVKEAESEDRVSKEEIEKRKAIMKRIKNRIIDDDFWRK